MFGTSRRYVYVDILHKLNIAMQTRVGDDA